MILLAPHRDFPCPEVESLRVSAERRGAGGLVLRFELEGRLADIRLPPAAPPLFTDELWRRTCFEAFVRPEGGEGYLELNLSPSGAWAAYRFEGYRDGMTPADGIGPPGIAVEATAGGLILSASLDLGSAAPGDWRVGLSAVVERSGGDLGYFALAHPQGRPDFHHADCFALELPAPDRT